MDASLVGPIVAAGCCFVANAVTIALVARSAELRAENRFTRLEAAVESLTKIQRAEMAEIAKAACAHLRVNLDAGPFALLDLKLKNLETWAREHDRAKHYKREPPSDHGG